MDTHESENHLVISEDEIPTYMQVYKGLKDTFRGRTRFFLVHIEDDIWQLTVTNLISREWLEFCATVYSELPDEQEVVEVSEEVQQNLQAMHDNFVPSSGYQSAPEEEEPEGTYDEETEEVEEDEETPIPEAAGPRFVKKAVLVKKATNVGNNVTVEED